MSYNNPVDIRNGDETDDGSVENVEPANVLGGRKGQGATDVIPKGEATDLINKAGEKGAENAVNKKDKEPSLKIRIKLNLHIKLQLDAQIDGDIEIGLL